MWEADDADRSYLRDFGTPQLACFQRATAPDSAMATSASVALQTVSHTYGPTLCLPHQPSYSNLASKVLPNSREPLDNLS